VVEGTCALLADSDLVGEGCVSVLSIAY